MPPVVFLQVLLKKRHLLLGGQELRLRLARFCRPRPSCSRLFRSRIGQVSFIRFRFRRHPANISP